MTKIKICGLKSEADISYANALKPDYIGFVFLKGRARYISPEHAAYLRSLLNPAIQSVGVFVNEPIEHVSSLLQKGTIQAALSYPCDYLLLDNGLGTGQTFDWSLIRDIRRPFFLAGGLTADNVKNALSLTHPYGVDISSGVETDGHKDFTKMEAFIQAVKSGTKKEA